MTQLSPWAETIFKRTYAFDDNETWEGCANRVSDTVANDYDQKKRFFNLINDRIFIPGGRYLFSSGREIFANSNCYGFMAQDSREGWAGLLHDVTLCLSTGGGLGVNYSEVRERGSRIGRLGGTATGPTALMQMVNEVARHVYAGQRRSALWAGLHWKHPDIYEFLTIKDWDDNIKQMKSLHFNYPAPLDMTNISVIIDNDYLHQLADKNPHVMALHADICERMTRTGEPAFRNESRIFEDDPGAITGNACQEATLHDNDNCNLGSIVMPRILNINHLIEVTQTATEFLYNGSVKATYPTGSIGAVAHRLRRIGMGIMGLHEWMIMHGTNYRWTSELEEWMNIWKLTSDESARSYARKLRGNVPITTRAIAPTGTISIIAETTSGIEPMFCKAYKRRYIDKMDHKFQYVIDPVADRLHKHGHSIDDIEDAYELSTSVTRRLDVQSNVQRYVDQAISNTINLPAHEEYKHMNEHISSCITENMHSLKGVTCYPDGARSGQPLTSVNWEEAYENQGKIFEQSGDCAAGGCGL